MEAENSVDIMKYVRGELSPYFWNDRTINDLLDDIIQRASGVFIWVTIILPEIVKKWQRGQGIKTLRKGLLEIPFELQTLYSGMLNSLDYENLPFSLLLMQWVCLALRPLTVEELRHAMNIELNTAHSNLSECQDSEHYSETSAQMRRRILSLCGGLVEIEELHGQPTARPIHHTAKDFLLRTGLQSLSKGPEKNLIGLAHSRLSRLCIKYMTLKEIPRALDAHHHLSEEPNNEFPLLRYAVMNWVVHAEIAEAEQISQQDLPGLFLSPKTNQLIELWTRLFHLFDSSSDNCPAFNTTLFHTASRHNLLSVISAMFEAAPSMKVDIKDEKGCTPLHWAVSGRHEAVVRLLIGKGANVNLHGRPEGNALQIASTRGDMSMVQLLLDRGANINDPGGPNGTALQAASVRGDMSMVRLLMNYGADFDAPGRPPELLYKRLE